MSGVSDNADLDKKISEANQLYGRLCGSFGKQSYKSDAYTVDGRSSDAFPEYYGGFYINSKGDSVILIVDEYYDNSGDSDWHSHIESLIKNDQNVFFRQCKYSYAELIDTMTLISVNPEFQKALPDAGIKKE